MIGIPFLVAALVAAALGHFVLAAAFGLIAAAELALWAPHE